MFHRLHLDLEASSDHRKKNIKNFIYDALDDMYFSVKSHRVNNRGQEIPAQIQKKRARRETLLNRHRRIFFFFFFSFLFLRKSFCLKKREGIFFWSYTSLQTHQYSTRQNFCLLIYIRAERRNTNTCRGLMGSTEIRGKVFSGLVF